MANSPMDDLLDQTRELGGPVLALKTVKQLLEGSYQDADLNTITALRYAKEMAETAEKVTQSGDPAKMATLSRMGGPDLMNDLSQYNASPSPAGHAQIVQDFQQITADTVKRTYNVDMTLPEPQANAQTTAPVVSTGPNAQYENTVRQIAAINPEAAKTFQAWAELDVQGNVPSMAATKAQLRALLGGEINDSVVAAAQNHDELTLKAAKNFLGEGLTLRGDTVDKLVAAPGDGRALYAMAEAVRNKALNSGNDPRTVGAVEVERMSPQLQASLVTLSATLPDADRALMSLAHLSQENDKQQRPAGSGIDAAIDQARTLNYAAFVTEMQSAEKIGVKSPDGQIIATADQAKQAVLDFVKSQGGKGDAPDAIREAARHAIEAGVSGGQASALPTSQATTKVVQTEPAASPQRS